MKKTLLLSIISLSSLSLFSCKNLDKERSSDANSIQSEVSATKEPTKSDAETVEPNVDGEIPPASLKKLKMFINYIKNNNVDEVKKLVDYPLKRKKPIKAIENEAEFAERFNEVFSNELKKKIITGTWSGMGERGIMLESGDVWFNGKLMAVNYQSSIEKEQIRTLVGQQKEKLHSSLKNFVQPIAIIQTKKFLVRIDEVNDYKYRYASWNLGSLMSSKPSLVINNGELIPEGSGGNHRYEFKNKEFTYIIDMIVLGASNSPEARLRVLKNGKEIISQDGKIITEDQVKLSKKTSNLKPLPKPTEEYYTEKLGDYLHQYESIGDFELGTNMNDVIKIYGKPERVEEPILADAMGEYLGSADYPSKGISFSTVLENKKETIKSIYIKEPCKLKTKRNIGIGSSLEELIKAYQPHLNPNKFKGQSEIILGSYYSGMSVDLKNNKITNITLGLHAE